MSVSEVLVKQLASYGLTANESAVYLFLSQYGPRRIADIANMNTLPRSSVYEAIHTLEQQGLAATTIEGTYKHIRALPFDSIKHYLNSRVEHLQKLIESADGVDASIAKLPDLQDEKPTSVRYYKQVAGARQLFWNSLHAKDPVFVYSSWGRSDYIGKTFYERFVSESKSRRISEKVIVNDQPAVLNMIHKQNNPRDQLSRTEPKDIRVLPASTVRIKGETLIYNNVYAQVYLKGGVITGFEVENAEFAKTQRSIFETLYSSGSKLKTRLGAT